MAYSTMSGDKAPTLNSIPVVANPLSVVTEEEIRDLDSPVNNKHVSGKKKGSMYLIEMNDGSLQLGIASGSRADDKWFIDDETDSIFAVEFKVTAGLFDFSLAGATNIRWYFPEDGTISTASQPAKTLTEAQTVVLSAKWGDEAELNSNGTDENYVGDLSDLSNVSYYLRLSNCSNITGDLSDVSNVSYFLRLSNCSNITGDLSDVSNVSYYLNLFNCSNITGDLSDVSNVSYYLRLSNCSNITGDLSDVSNVSYYLNLFNCSNITGDLSDVSNVSYLLDLYGCSNITGDLSDVSNVSYLLNLYGYSNITGDLSDVSNVSYYLNLFNCSNITGDLSDVSNVSYLLNLYGCSNVTGDLSDVSNVSYFLDLSNCSNVTGSLSSACTATYINLTNIDCSSAELDTTIANLVTANQSDGTLILTGLTRTSASSADVATLESRGWTVTDATVE
jgi:glucan-binding YG repeat protein